MQLEIIQATWRSHRRLTYQLSSLLLYPPRHNAITVTVAYSPDDHETLKTLTHFGSQEAANVRWHWVHASAKDCQDGEAVSRLARRQRADWCWFVESGTVVGNGALDAICLILNHETRPLVRPREVLACPQQITKKLLGTIRAPATTPLDHHEHFRPQRHGGGRFVAGPVAKVKGAGLSRSSTRLIVCPELYSIGEQQE